MSISLRVAGVAASVNHPSELSVQAPVNQSEIQQFEYSYKALLSIANMSLGFDKSSKIRNSAASIIDMLKIAQKQKDVTVIEKAATAAVFFLINEVGLRDSKKDYDKVLAELCVLPSTDVFQAYENLFKHPTQAFFITEKLQGDLLTRETARYISTECLLSPGYNSQYYQQLKLSREKEQYGRIPAAIKV